MRAGEDGLSWAPLLPTPILDAEHGRALGEGRAVIVDQVWPVRAVEGLRLAAERLWAGGELDPAGVGRDGHRDPRVRRDWTTWLEADGQGEASLAELWRWLERLRSALVEATWVSLQRFSVQLACYPGGGAHYARHVDALPGDPNRLLTALVYLNPGWRPTDGGQLRVWEPQGCREIDPLAGRLVVFRSDALPHAVLPAHARRWAVAAWYRGAEPQPLLADPRI